MNYSKVAFTLSLAVLPVLTLADVDSNQTAPNTEEAPASYTKSSAKFTA